MASLAWRQHHILPDLEESPEPDRFREKKKEKEKRPSLDLRRSFRQRRPLRETGANSAHHPAWEALQAPEEPGERQRSLRGALGAVSQKIQGRCRGPARRLAASLAKAPRKGPPGASPTPLTLTPTSTPGARGMGGSPSPPGGERRPLRPWREAALRSPYAAPAPAGRRRRFDGDLGSVSRGIRRLKRLSQAFNDIIVQEEREQAVFNYYEAMARNMRKAQRQARVPFRLNLRNHAEGWRRIRSSADSVLQR